MSRGAKHQAVRVRYTPTFSHHDIFGVEQENASKVRFTPTYTSSALCTQGYQLKTIHDRPSRRQLENAKEEIHNVSQKLSQYTERPKTAESRKVELLQEINVCNGQTSKMRKYVQQLSDPVFMGFSWEMAVKPKESPIAFKDQEVKEVGKEVVQMEKAQAQQPQRVVQVAQPVRSKTVEGRKREKKSNLKISSKGPRVALKRAC